MSLDIRRTVIEQSFRAGVGHIGSCLSIADVLAALYGNVLRGDGDDPARDRFILSKGHAVLAKELVRLQRLALDRIRSRFRLEVIDRTPSGLAIVRLRSRS